MRSRAPTTSSGPEACSRSVCLEALGAMRSITSRASWVRSKGSVRSCRRLRPSSETASRSLTMRSMRLAPRSMASRLWRSAGMRLLLARMSSCA